MDLSQTAALAQEIDGGGILAGGLGMILGCGGFVIGLLCLIGGWKTFAKANKPGWAIIIPIYQWVVLIEIVGRPMWWLILLLIPCTAPIAGIILTIDLAKSFGKDAVVGILCLFGIGWLMLGFGDAVYQGPAAAEGAAPPTEV